MQHQQVYRKKNITTAPYKALIGFLLSLLFVSDGYSQLFTLQNNDNYFSPLIFNDEKPSFRVISGAAIAGKPGVRYSISESSPLAAAADIDQIRNGGTTDVGTGSGTSWVNGNAGASNAHYAEGWSIAYRMKITGLTAGTHTLVIEWDTRNGNKSAIDFITHYQNMDDPIGSHQSTFGHTQEMMDPIFGFTGLGGASRYEIPEPTLPAAALATFRHLRDDYNDPSGDDFGKEALTIWGGTITDADYVSEGSYTAKDASTRMSITFTTTNATTAIIAWGGHIASRADWGPNNSAGAVNGSSYHTRLISIDGGGGNQDRSLSASAVIIPPLVCPGITPTSRTVCVGTASMIYTYTPEAGVTYKWTLTNNNPSAGAKLQGEDATTHIFTTTGGTVTVIPSSTNFTAGSFNLNLVMTKVGVTDKTCPFPNVGTVVANPTVYTLSGNAICASAPNTGVITLSNSQTGVSYQLKKTSDNSNVQTAQNGSTGNALTWTALPASVSYYVLATGASQTSCTSQTGNASVSETTNPSAPAVTYVPPACDSDKFSVTVGSAGNPVIAGASYSIVDKNGAAITGVSPASIHVATALEATNGFSFSNIQAGSGYRVIVTSQSCASSATTCGTSSLRTSTNNASLGTTEVVEATIQAPTPTKVLAAPNPFNDRIRFSLQSAVSGKGSLELFNMLGQRVKVLYQGYVQKGVTQNIEYDVPGSQRANLIYVFTVGDQRVSGKLIGPK